MGYQPVEKVPKRDCWGGTSLSVAKGVVWLCTTPFATLRDVPPKFDNYFFPGP